MMTTHMVEQESQIDKESSILNCKANEISRSLEFNRIELNNGFTNNFLQRCFMKFTNNSNFLFYLIYLLNIIFYSILSYFAKSNFISYDE